MPLRFGERRAPRVEPVRPNQEGVRTWVATDPLLHDSGKPIGHPQVHELFAGLENGRYITRFTHTN